MATKIGQTLVIQPEGDADQVKIKPEPVNAYPGEVTSSAALRPPPPLQRRPANCNATSQRLVRPSGGQLVYQVPSGGQVVAPGGANNQFILVPASQAPATTKPILVGSSATASQIRTAAPSRVLVPIGAAGAAPRGGTQSFMSARVPIVPTPQKRALPGKEAALKPSPSKETKSQKTSTICGLMKVSPSGKAQLYMCNYCSYTSNDQQGYMHHVLASHIFSCNHCDYKGFSRYDVVNHTRTKHVGFNHLYKNIRGLSLGDMKATIGHRAIELDPQAIKSLSTVVNGQAPSKPTAGTSLLDSNPVRNAFVWQCQHCSFTNTDRMQVIKHVRKTHKGKPIIVQRRKYRVAPSAATTSISPSPAAKLAAKAAFADKLPEVDEDLNLGGDSGAEDVLIGVEPRDDSDLEAVEAEIAAVEAAVANAEVDDVDVNKEAPKSGSRRKQNAPKRLTDSAVASPQAQPEAAESSPKMAATGSLLAEVTRSLMESGKTSMSVLDAAEEGMGGEYVYRPVRSKYDMMIEKLNKDNVNDLSLVKVVTTEPRNGASKKPVSLLHPQKKMAPELPVFPGMVQDDVIMETASPRSLTPTPETHTTHAGADFDIILGYKGGATPQEQLDDMYTHEEETGTAFCKRCSFFSSGGDCIAAIRKHCQSDHTESRQWGCPYCTYQCDRRQRMVNHVKWQHAGKPLNIVRKTPYIDKRYERSIKNRSERSVSPNPPPPVTSPHAVARAPRMGSRSLMSLLTGQIVVKPGPKCSKPREYCGVDRLYTCAFCGRKDWRRTHMVAHVHHSHPGEYVNLRRSGPKPRVVKLSADCDALDDAKKSVSKVHLLDLKAMRKMGHFEGYLDCYRFHLQAQTDMPILERYSPTSAAKAAPAVAMETDEAPRLLINNTGDTSLNSSGETAKTEADAESGCVASGIPLKCRYCDKPEVEDMEELKQHLLVVHRGLDTFCIDPDRKSRGLSNLIFLCPVPDCSYAIYSYKAQDKFLAHLDLSHAGAIIHMPFSFGQKGHVVAKEQKERENAGLAPPEFRAGNLRELLGSGAKKKGKRKARWSDGGSSSRKKTTRSLPSDETCEMNGDNNTHTASKRYGCAHCDLFLETPMQTRIHLARDHADTEFIARDLELQTDVFFCAGEDCMFWTTDTTSYSAHPCVAAKQSAPTEPTAEEMVDIYQCSYCDFKTKYRLTIKAHVRDEHGKQHTAPRGGYAQIRAAADDVTDIL